MWSATSKTWLANTHSTILMTTWRDVSQQTCFYSCTVLPAAKLCILTIGLKWESIYCHVEHERMYHAHVHVHGESAKRLATIRTVLGNMWMQGHSALQNLWCLHALKRKMFRLRWKSVIMLKTKSIQYRPECLTPRSEGNIDFFTLAVAANTTNDLLNTGKQMSSCTTTCLLKSHREEWKVFQNQNQQIDDCVTTALVSIQAQKHRALPNRTNESLDYNIIAAAIAAEQDHLPYSFQTNLSLIHKKVQTLRCKLCPSARNNLVNTDANSFSIMPFPFSLSVRNQYQSMWRKGLVQQSTCQWRLPLGLLAWSQPDLWRRSP